MTWAQEHDLLLGDLETGYLDKTQYLEFAEDEINACLGVYYVLPLPTLSTHNQLTLKVTQARLASGRLFLALASGGEDSELHAYGRHLIELAMGELSRIGRDYELMDDSGNPVVNMAASGESKAATAVRPLAPGTSEDPFDVYERFVHAESYDYWTPNP